VKAVSSLSTILPCIPYKMLPELDKNPPIPLEHPKRPGCASLVTSLEHALTFLGVLDIFSLAESRAVANLVRTYPINNRPKGYPAYSFIQTRSA